MLLNAAAQTAAATTAPCVLMLVDLLGFYPIIVKATGAQTLNNSVTLPRYTNGAGVQAFLTPSTGHGRNHAEPFHRLHQLSRHRR